MKNSIGIIQTIKTMFPSGLKQRAESGWSNPSHVMIAAAKMLALAFIFGLGGEPWGNTLAAQPLTSLDYRITGTSLEVSPSVVSVPKGIAGSVLPLVLSGGATNSVSAAQLSSGAYIQAILRGPGFPQPRKLVGSPNAPLVLPAINLVGDYQLDNIALVDAVSGETRLEGLPSSVPIHVFDEVLISTVTSRPLTYEEIQQKGIVIDESNFRAVEFNVSFVLDGKTIPIKFPVVAPQFKDSVELIPAAEVEARLQQAAVINQKISSEIVQLPPELQTARLNLQIQGINFQAVDPGEGQSLALSIPPIPALMVIPGNIGYLHQFFSVKIFTENGAPIGSGLTVDNIRAHLNLPFGADGISASNYETPGDDPLRFARIGPDKIINSQLQVVDPGADGDLGTSDDVTRLKPGQTGQAEFLVEGLQEGLQVMNLDLTADLYGLAAGPVQVKGKAAGSVLVRNPKFSIAFSHPRTVRTGEPYVASVTILNTGVVPANLVQVSLRKNSISGATLAAGQSETVELNTILPGETATATYHLVAQRTGQITFSDLTTSDDSITGRFRFSMGVDAQGVPLSPDTIAMPDYVNALPADLVAAATRVLGQALSIATAGQLPPGVAVVNNSIITRRVLDLAEAGQRVAYGDPLSRVLPDLMRDWEGGRNLDSGWDQLLRTSDAGAVWRSVLFGDMESIDRLSGTERLLDRALDLAGLGQQFVLGGSGPGQLRLDFAGGTNNAVPKLSTQPYAYLYSGTNGSWASTHFQSNGVFTWSFTNEPAQADMAVLLVGTNGQAQELRWRVPNPPPDAIYMYVMGDPSGKLQVDLGRNGSVDTVLSPTSTEIQELPPRLVAVEQDLSVLAGRPAAPCIGPDYSNYGTVVAVVFSKPMTQESAGLTNSYVVDGDNGANSVQVQPSGRVVLLNLRKGISAIRPRNLTILGVTDARSNALPSTPIAIHSVVPGTEVPFMEGVAVRGHVIKGNGSPASGVPVTLTMYDLTHGSLNCEDWVRRVSQVITDPNGDFDFDFVMAGIPYSISATDTSGLSTNALQLILESTVAGQPDTQRLEQLINASAQPSSLLSLLSSGSLPEAIAVVDGLDRALVRDVVLLGSSRQGQEVPVALRFRGRGLVTGKVVAEDGHTPIPNAAVNLYPDPSSRELGRGVFSDNNGQFFFPGVPLGVFSVDVTTADKRAATVLGVINTPGQSTDIVVALPSNPVLYGVLRGQVFDSDNYTIVPNARILLGRYHSGDSLISGVVRMVDADSSGAWQITNAPIQKLDVVAVTFDGTRKGIRVGVTPLANQITYANVTLQAATTVYGQVQFYDGRPAVNALVAGGAALVRTDANGRFQLEGVPVGSATISAGLEKNPDAGIDFTRLGSASANIIAGQANFVVVKLRPAGRIFGKVFNAQGNLVPNVRVSIPVAGGFYYTDADSNGNYVFDNIGLGNYTVSAPGNAVSPKINESELSAQIRSGDEDQILAAFQEAVRVFVGADDPLITGEQLNFRPSSWGYTTANLGFDGASVNANIRYIPQGSVSGQVQNSQGVPIGARVRLTGLGPDVSGAPVVTIRGEANSDPATGRFSFPNELLAGPWGIQVASPFYPSVLVTNGYTTEIDPDVTNIVLRFPPVQEVNGRIAGRVFNPEGTLASDGVRVHINISDDYQILTDTNGFFDTQTAFPALGRGYTVEAFDPVSGLKGRAGIAMTPGITNFVDVQLLSKESTIRVVVLRANSKPAIGAQVELDQGSYPNESPLFGTTDTNGVATFSGLWEGNYAVSAQYTEASTRLTTRGGSTVGPKQISTISLRLGGTGSVEGKFLAQDQITPIYGAQVSIGNLGFATTDTNGFFHFDGVPIGAYQVLSSDPVTGGMAATTAAVTYDGQLLTIRLVEASLGVVSGFVLDSYKTGFIAGSKVRIDFSDGLTPARTVTTGPSGGFSLPGSPLGPFTLNATYTVPGTLDVEVTGRASGVLSSTATNANVVIQLQPLAYLTVRVVRGDGVTPARNARVTLAGATSGEQDTGTNGEVQFSNLRVPGEYSIRAISEIGGELHSGSQTSITLTERASNSVVTLMLSGVANISGQVIGSDGISAIPDAEIKLQYQGPLFSGGNVTAISDSQGRFTFSDVPLGSFLVSAAYQSLAASENGNVTTAGETNRIVLHLGSSGSLFGRLLRADHITPASGTDISIDYTSQSQNAGKALFRTGPDGRFRFDQIPVGPVHISSAAPAFSGILDFDVAITANGQLLDLGDIVFDEDLPHVVQVSPSDTEIEVPITNSINLVFSEAISATSLNTNGLFIRGTNGIVNSSITLLSDSNGVPNQIQITPIAPLRSKAPYEIIVLSGDLPGPAGGILGSGPRDLVGRTLPAPFVSHFTTADNTPPVLLSIFPSNSAVQIDPRSVPRLSFDKALRPTGFSFDLTGPNGPVAGSASVGINGQVLSFVPTAPLLPNTIYTLTVSNVLDLAGNRAAGEPFVATFATLDTIGPLIRTLSLASNALPVAGATVPVVAVLVGTEPGVTVRFTQDFNPVGSLPTAPDQALIKMPASGTTTIRAIATDQYGNDGPFAELVLVVQLPHAPSLELQLISPTNGFATNGAVFVVDAIATGDTEITNISARITGTLNGGILTTNGPALRVQDVVPLTATPEDVIQIFARAMDSLGLSSTEQVITLGISDTVLPTLSLVSPEENARLTAPSVPIVARFSDNSSNVAVSIVISGALTYTQSIASVAAPNLDITNIFTIPLSGAPANGGSILATVAAMDKASNTTVVTRRFWLPNTVGPSIASLQIASNLPPTAGFTVPVRAVVTTNLPGTSVRFTQDGKLVGILTNAPYEVRVVLPLIGSTTLTAVATDPFGFEGIAAQLVINVEQNTHPDIQFARVSPPTGPVPSGGTFSVDINASGNSGFFDIFATLSGAAISTNVNTRGTVLHVQGQVQPNAVAGDEVVVTAHAVDANNQPTDQKVLKLLVSDGTGPSLAILSPPPFTQVSAGQTFAFVIASSDNSSKTTLKLEVTGAYTNSQKAVLTLSPNQLVTNTFNIPVPAAATNGAPILVTITGTDDSGNITTVSRFFWLPGTQTTSIWNRQALGQTFTCPSNGRRYTWPNNSLWSQSAQYADFCGTGDLVLTAPSNWSSTNYPNSSNIDVILSGGATVQLDVSVLLHSLTVFEDSLLRMNAGTSITANNYVFQGDGTISIANCCAPPSLTLTNGIMIKTAGTNVFLVQPGIPLHSYNGNFWVESGELDLPGNNSTYTNGTFYANANSVLRLVPEGHSSFFSGLLIGSGGGAVVMSSGTLNSDQGGATLNFDADLFQWVGGTLAGNNPLTNQGYIELTAPTDVYFSGTLQNLGTVNQWASGGRLGLNAGAHFVNAISGNYNLEAKSDIYQSSCCAPASFDNYGVLTKGPDTNESVISLSFNNLGGTVNVQEGNLVLANRGSSSNGTFNISAGATLDPTGGGDPTWAGEMKGQGLGLITLYRGTIHAIPSLVLNFPGTLFNWSGGSIVGGNVSNINTIYLSGENDRTLSGEFDNAGLIRHSGPGRMGLNAGAYLRTLPGGTYRMEEDNTMYVSACCAPPLFENEGLLIKSGGTNASTINVPFSNNGGIIEVDSGSLVLSRGGSSSNANIKVAAGSLLDLTGGASPIWAGLLASTGSGKVQLQTGTIRATPLLTLNAAPGMFQWNGGTFDGLIVNTNEVAISGTDNSYLSGLFTNSAVLRHMGPGALGLNAGARFENDSNGLYRFESSAGAYQSSCCAGANFDNFGTILKTDSITNTVISVRFNNKGGLIDSQMGTLVLANNGESTNGRYTAAEHAAIDITGGASPTWSGLMSGQGAGALMLSGGTLNCSALSLNFANEFFQWTGGTLAGVATNLNTVVLAGTGVRAIGNEFDNAKLVRHSGGDLGLNAGSVFRNMAGATYQIETSGLIYVSTCCASPSFENSGLLHKTAGGDFNMNVNFKNLGGTVQVDSGSLILRNNGSSVSGTFVVASGASVDLTGGASPNWSGQIDGSGNGRIFLSSGRLEGNAGLVMNFAPGLFVWGGGTLAGIVTNINEVRISDVNGYLDGKFFNYGIVRSSNGSLGLAAGSAFSNMSGAEYRIGGDGSVYVSTCCAGADFYNSGLLHKTGGSQSSISTRFANQNGSIQVDNGTLDLGGNVYAQGSGSLLLRLNSTNSAMLKAGAVTLNGPLHITLEDGYVPSIGTEFPIVQGTSVTGKFSSVDLPSGLSVEYRGNTVVIVVTGQVLTGQSLQPFGGLSIDLSTPGLVSLEWPASTAGTIESTPALRPDSIWKPVTNFTEKGTGGISRINLPFTNKALFFRLRSSVR